MMHNGAAGPIVVDASMVLRWCLVMAEEIFEYRHAASAAPGRAHPGVFSAAVGVMAGISLISPAVFPSFARRMYDTPTRWLVVFSLCSIVPALLAGMGLASGLWSARRHGWGRRADTAGVLLNIVVLLALAVVMVHNVVLLR